ncbi:MAG: hypothetical protein JST54_11265 [Deltaproteobacteria bacterium]|nr:hypothetical protein [Deltaproteobacteria bacterium]
MPDDQNLDVVLDRAVWVLLKHSHWPAAIWLQAFRLKRTGTDAEPWFQLGTMAANRARAIRDLPLLELALRCFARAKKLRPSHVEANFMLDTLKVEETFPELQPFQGDPMQVAEAAEATHDDLRGAVLGIEDAEARRKIAKALLDQEELELSAMTVLDMLDSETEPENLRLALETAVLWSHLDEVKEAVRVLPQRVKAEALAPALEEALRAIEQEEED